MKQPTLLFSALLTLANLSCGPKDVSTQAKPGRIFNQEDQRRFVYLAILEGLLEECADPPTMEAATKDRDRLFVLKCPICMPIHEAIQAYLNSAKRVMGPATGAEFPEDLLKGLKSEDRKVQLKAMESMVERYVARRYDRYAMTAGEKAQMKTLLEEAKKQGMSLKNQVFGDFCPSCSGATKGGK